MGSGLMAWLIIWTQIAQNLVLGQSIFWYLIILLDSTYYLGENKIMFVKSEARVLDLWLDNYFGSKSLQCFSLSVLGSRPQG